jgi:hypothetical protein
MRTAEHYESTFRLTPLSAARTVVRPKDVPGVSRRSVRWLGLTADGVSSDKPDRGGTDEQDYSDDCEPEQTFEGEPDNRRNKPNHKQNDDENGHTILRTFEIGLRCSLTYLFRARRGVTLKRVC